MLAVIERQAGAGIIRCGNGESAGSVEGSIGSQMHLHSDGFILGQIVFMNQNIWFGNINDWSNRSKYRLWRLVAYSSDLAIGIDWGSQRCATTRRATAHVVAAACSRGCRSRLTKPAGIAVRHDRILPTEFVSSPT